MISPHPLDRLVEQAAFAEMVALLEPEELVIASLRLEDLSDDQIASLLDIDRATVRYRMEQARQRIVEALPEMASVLSNRRHAPARDPRPLERGWLCPSIGGEPGSLAGCLLDPPRQAAEPRLPGRVEKRELSEDSSPVFAVPG